MRVFLTVVAVGLSLLGAYAWCLQIERGASVWEVFWGCFANLLPGALLLVLSAPPKEDLVVPKVDYEIRRVEPDYTWTAGEAEAGDECQCEECRPPANGVRWSGFASTEAKQWAGSPLAPQQAYQTGGTAYGWCGECGRYVAVVGHWHIIPHIDYVVHWERKP